MSRVLLAALALVVTGCAAPYQIGNNAKAAEFVIARESDSTSTNLRNTFAWAFEDESCQPSKNGIKLVGKINNNSSVQTDPVRIAADVDFVFTAVYVEARFGQTRECLLTAKFTPTASHRYKAKITTLDGVRACSLGIYDITAGIDERVEFSMPEYACAQNASLKILNGRPLWTNVKVQVTTVPSK